MTTPSAVAPRLFIGVLSTLFFLNSFAFAAKTARFLEPLLVRKLLSRLLLRRLGGFRPFSGRALLEIARELAHFLS